MMPWARRVMGACALALAALPLACVRDTGRWEPATEPTAPTKGRDLGATVAHLYLLGDAAAGRHGRAVAQELATHLAADRAAGTPAHVLWLGDDGRACAAGSDAAGAAALARVVSSHGRSASEPERATAWAIPGEADLTCGEGSAAPTALPAVIRLDHLGRLRQVGACAEGTCAVEPTTELDLLDLVLVTDVAWAPRGPGDQAPAALDAAAPLLAALPAEGPPRLLVSHLPLESPGVHGLGGAVADATLRLHPPAVRAAYSSGAFAGVLSAHERELAVITDLRHATMRAHKAAAPHAVFQIVAGAASDAPADHPAHRLRRLRSLAARADMRTSGPGFARLAVTADGTLDLALVARRGRRWRVGHHALSLHPAHDTPRDYGPMDPCPECAEVPAESRP